MEWQKRTGIGAIGDPGALFNLDVNQAHALCTKSGNQFVGMLFAAVGDYDDLHRVAGIIQREDIPQFLYDPGFAVADSHHHRNGLFFEGAHKWSLPPFGP